MNKHCDELPIAVVRPSIVINAWREPYKGWTDTLNGPAGMAVMAGIGCLRSVMASEEVKCALVYVNTRAVPCRAPASQHVGTSVAYI